MIVPGKHLIGQIAAEIHGANAHSGLFKGWEVYGRFEITQQMFETLTVRFPTKVDRREDAQARIVSYTTGGIDLEGAVTSALVVYRYDTVYYCAVLFNPVIFASSLPS